jgi:hypothetical protein
MGQPTTPSPVLPLLAAFSRHPEALAWARRRACEAWGPIEAESPAFAFQETSYYDATMGSDLHKVFFAFARLGDPAALVETKLTTNGWEEEYAAAAGHPEPRPLNLDPGYLTLGKLVLASTKDFVHRMYLARGIYAEVTLYYRQGRWEHHQWTFADYRRSDYQVFFSQVRESLHRKLREGPVKQ